MRKLFKDVVSLLSDTSSILADESIDNGRVAILRPQTRQTDGNTFGDEINCFFTFPQ